MSELIFCEKLVKPDDKQLKYALGKTYVVVEKIFGFLNKEYGDIKPEWKFYGNKYGWQLKIFYKKRNILFLIPYEGYFKIGMVFGDKAIEKVLQSNLPENIKTGLLNAKKYIEGRGISLEIKFEKDFETIKELIQIKLS